MGLSPIKYYRNQVWGAGVSLPIEEGVRPLSNFFLIFVSRSAMPRWRRLLLPPPQFITECNSEIITAIGPRLPKLSC